MSDKPNLEEIRKELDDLNERMLDTISQRMQLVEKVAAAKLAQPGQKLRDKERERVMLAELAKKAREKGLNPYYVKRIFNDLIEYSLDDQSRHMSRRDPAETKDLVRIGFQGVEGAYSHLAAQKHFAKDLENAAFVGYSTFGDAFRACERGDLDFVVLPLENTIGGSINATYRLLEDSALHIVGEEVWQVQHCLIGLENVPLGRVRHIASHPQALLQCSAFLASLPGITVESFTDTAEAVRRLKERQEITHAAIASEDAAERYGLHVLKRDIADQKENYTKFVVCAKNPVEYDARLDTKISLVLATNHKEGALLQCLRPFHEHGLNLLKLESRPKLHTPWEYQFYVDFEGHIADQNVTNALEQIQRHTSYLKVLGCYPIRTQGFDAVQVAEDVESTALKEEVAGAFCETPAEPAKTKSAKPYRLAARESGDEKTEIKVGDVVLGDGSFTVIAGPCAVESREQIMESAKLVRDLGGVMLRGGVFKPRTSPYSFQGMGYEGLDYLVEAGKTYGLPIVTEVMHPQDVMKVAAKADVIQIGARNMQNFSLLSELGRCRRPILLKRGMMASIDELLMAAEYILAGGNSQVILCERGIRTFETATRNTLDLQAIPVLKRLTHLPIIVDPSHAAGDRELVVPMALAAAAAGADGIIVETHPHPDQAICDGPQALTPEQFRRVTSGVQAIGRALAGSAAAAKSA